jgi:superfamily I DNA/RNA helicase
LWRFEEALEQRGIPVSTQAGKGFFRRQEIQDLIAVTRAIADARDTLALGAPLRGPLVGLTEARTAGRSDDAIRAPDLPQKTTGPHDTPAISAPVRPGSPAPFAIARSISISLYPHLRATIQSPAATPP